MFTLVLIIMIFGAVAMFGLHHRVTYLVWLYSDLIAWVVLFVTRNWIEAPLVVGMTLVFLRTFFLIRIF